MLDLYTVLCCYEVVIKHNLYPRGSMMLVWLVLTSNWRLLTHFQAVFELALVGFPLTLPSTAVEKAGAIPEVPFPGMAW